jgi:futalosine hydrolase
MARILVVTAVEAEARAVLGGLEVAGTRRIGPYGGTVAQTAAGSITVVAGGVGPARSAACAGTALAVDRPDLVVSAGVAGGFADRAAPGDVVIADRVLHADLGADAPGGFAPLDPHLAGDTAYALDTDLVAAAASRTEAAVVGPVLTVSTVTGTAARAAELAGRHDAAAEAMEGAGVYAAARAHGVPFLEIRAISNVVGPRDRDAWEIPRALDALGRAFAGLAAAPWPQLDPAARAGAR